MDAMKTAITILTLKMKQIPPCVKSAADGGGGGMRSRKRSDGSCLSNTQTHHRLFARPQNTDGILMTKVVKTIKHVFKLPDGRH